MKRIVSDKSKSSPLSAIQVGVVGLGLMGRSISACLLAAGHVVTAFDADPARRRRAGSQILSFLRQMQEERLVNTAPRSVVARFHPCASYQGLASCGAVIEAVTESLTIKKQVLRKIERVVPADCLIASNTSAIPISSLQATASHPERIVGMHWAEPAHVTRFMEIISGRHTSPEYARTAIDLARRWGKEPSLVQRDVRGFITNRISYAMFREACHLVDTGVATVADIDRSLRNDLGYYILFCGVFRLMDLMGIPAYAAVMKDLLPDLSRDTRVPRLMRKMMKSGAKGVANCKGFYPYTPAQAKRWEELFVEFNYDVRKLAKKYPENAGDRPDNNRRTIK